ncbi:DUF2332 family protein [Pseudactinotalea sp.]|uniref:DUF2332 family protein n=1 Tax=Pseudactinotalea sp. TaxID=1926260 RepID=UPI003B3A8599
MEVDAPDIAGLYRRFAEIEARGSSATYERLCLAVADDAATLRLLATLPRGKRQPNLLLGALRLLGADVADPPAALAFAEKHAADVRSVMLARSTQTNEPARCSVLLPALARLPEPLAILEVGASAGLCLPYEQYTYVYDVGDQQVRIGDGVVALPCTAVDVPLPASVPQIAARLGLDANPLDAADPETAAWLRCLIWPEHTDRAQRLTAALTAVAADPPRVIQGLAPESLPDAIEQLRRQAPEATPVVVHSAMVAYLDRAARAEFGATCRELGVHRIGLEGAEPTRDLGVRVGPGEFGGRFLLTLDDAVLGHAHPHGRELVWLG